MRGLALTGAAVATINIGAVASPAQADAASSRYDKTERRVVRLVNKNRAAMGLPQVRVSRALTRSADFHSRDMLRRNFFAHHSSNGTSMGVRVRRYKRAGRLGETLAYVPGRGGQARRVVSMWLNSPSHRAVLLSPSFRRIGLARRTGRLGRARATVFTADFASR